MVLFAWPLTTSDEVAQVLRPGGQILPDSALRALRDKGCAPAPISVVTRSEARANGRAVWYSSLLLDVARLVRRGELEAARALNDAAAELAVSRSAVFVAHQLAEAAGEPDAAVIDRDSGGALSRLALLTASTRRRLPVGVVPGAFTGRVSEVSGAIAVIVDEEGHVHRVPIGDAPPYEWTGAAVSVDIEQLPNGAVTLWTRPAFPHDVDPHERVPGSPVFIDLEQLHSDRAAT
jgi:hypothetical protein